MYYFVVKNFLLFMLFSLLFGNVFADELNCLLCHKYKGLSRIDDNGEFKLYYVNEHLYNNSPHSKNTCADCHITVKEVPHKNVKKVDCTTKCHIYEPSSDTKYSHKEVQEILDESVHSKFKKDGTLKKNQDDYPTCKDCHEQPLIRPFAVAEGMQDLVSEKSISRCKSCHTTGKFAEKFFLHVSTRLQKQRNPKDVIAMCAKCHADKGIQKRHELDDVISSYKETFHYKLISLGSEKAPDCLDCHIVRGESVHLIESQKSQTSATHKDNKGQTCQSAGCHPKASVKLAGFQTHVTYDYEDYPLQFYMLMFFRIMLAFVLYGFLAIVFLELVRRLAPNVALFKSGHQAKPKVRSKERTKSSKKIRTRPTPKQDD
ncbi:MAG: hypothetical protein ACC657_13640 [Thiohalomonadales bacterium]